MKDTQIEVLRVEISKLSLSADDYLVLRFPPEESVANVAHFLYAFRNGFPELMNHIVAFIGDVEISVIHKEEK